MLTLKVKELFKNNPEAGREKRKVEQLKYNCNK
jgi:hypothetical protein